MADFDALAFTADQAIKAGLIDRHLDTLRQSIHERTMILNPRRKPSIPLPKGQVWAWMGGAKPPQWEVRGTGVVAPDELIPEARRKATGR